METNRNIQEVRTTWGKWKSLQGVVAEGYNKEAALQLGVTDDSEIIAYKEVTPFGTFTHAIEWL